MDNEYYVDGVDGLDGFEEVEECDDTLSEINRQKELVALVKVNPHLWDKRHKKYCAKNKELAWAAVATVLGNMSGSDAEKEFYKIRQKYGKERRKVIMSLKGKSGKSTRPTYVSTWELYEICDSFLRAVIIPQKTSSNYAKPASLVKSNEASDSPAEFQVIVPEIVKPSTGHHYITTTEIFNADKTPDFCTSLSSDDTTCDSVISVSPQIPSQSPRQVQQVKAQLQSQTQSSSVIQTGVSREKVRQQVLRTMSQTTAKIIYST